MAKIDQTNDTGRLMPHPAPPQTRQPKTGDFQNVLGNALDKTGKTPPTGAPMINEANALEEIPSGTVFFPSSMTPSNQEITERTDRLIGLLDRYTAQLENPDIPLKEVAPVLEEIRTFAQDLLDGTSGNSALDPEMKRIATEAAVMANKEVLKFQRGDYLS